MLKGEKVAQREGDNKAWWAVLIILLLFCIGILAGILVTRLVIRNNENDVIDDNTELDVAKKVCSKIEKEYVNISKENLGELVDEFEEVVGGGNEFKASELANCYVILRDFYQQGGNEEKTLYYDGILDEILPQDDRDLEELMGEE